MVEIPRFKNTHGNNLTKPISWDGGDSGNSQRNNEHASSWKYDSQNRAYIRVRINEPARKSQQCAKIYREQEEVEGEEENKNNLTCCWSLSLSFSSNATLMWPYSIIRIRLFCQLSWAKTTQTPKNVPATIHLLLKRTHNSSATDEQWPYTAVVFNFRT